MIPSLVAAFLAKERKPMEETRSLDLSSVLVSVASSVVEANRVLSEGLDTPMGITEFTIQYRMHASLYVRELASRETGIRITETGFPVLEKPRIKSAQLHNLTVLTPKEKILTGYQQEADLIITTRMEPLPRLE
jgi:hypothetical protein